MAAASRWGGRLGKPSMHCVLHIQYTAHPSPRGWDVSVGRERGAACVHVHASGGSVLRCVQFVVLPHEAAASRRDKNSPKFAEKYKDCV